MLGYFYEVTFYDTYNNKYHLTFDFPVFLDGDVLSRFLNSNIDYLPNNRIRRKTLNIVITIKNRKLPPLDKSRFATPKEQLTLNLKRRFSVSEDEK